MADQQVVAAAEQLSQALEVMHRPGTSAEDLAAASTWLDQFQQSGLAWQVCEDLLQSSDQPYAVLLYAATAVRNKIRKQLQTLSQDAWPGLRDALAGCINKQLPSNRIASIQLCTAMSALVLQWRQWNDVLSYLETRLSTSGMMLLLEYLPQEPSDPVYGKLMSGGDAYEWEAQSQYRVRPWSHDVIAWLINVQLAEIAPSASQARCRQLTCFAAWVRLGAIFEAESAQLDKLIQLAFQCSLSLDADEFQAGSDTLLDVLEFSSEELHLRFSETMLQLLQAAVQFEVLTLQLASAYGQPTANGMLPLAASHRMMDCGLSTNYLLAIDLSHGMLPVSAASAGEMDRAARLCTVFNQFCDYNINLVGSTSQMGQKLRCGLLQAALIPASLENEPTSGEALAVGSLGVCHYLASHLQIPLPQDPDAPQDMMGPEDSRSFFQQLLQGLLHNLQPLQGPGETQLHSSPLREASKDTLAAACQMLGPQAFLHQVLQSVTGLGTPSSSVDPKQLEAALFAITSAAEVLSRCIEGGEGGDGPADEAAAASVAQLLLQLLLHLSAASTSLAHSSRERVHLLELLLMQTMAPTLMHHVAGTNVAQAQDVMNFVLGKAGNSLMQAEADPRASMSAARAIVEVCSVAQSHDMPMPSNVLDGLLQLVQQTTDPDAQQELVLAFATCLSCIAINPPAEPNRKHYTERLLHPLPIALQQLAPQQHGQLSSQQADSANAAALKGLKHTRTLMMFMQSWKDAQPSAQAQPSLSPAAEAFVTCWGFIQQALASGNASIAVQESAAGCCTAAVRMHLAACMSAMPSIMHTAACGVARCSATAHLWVPPLAAALDQLDGQELSQLSGSLQESLTIVDSSAAAQSLRDRSSADAKPDLSLGIIHLTSAIARNAVKLHAVPAPSFTLLMLERGILRAAVCMTCNHKDLSHASLSCVASVTDICSLQQLDAAAMVIRAGPSIVQGLLAALLAVSAVSRVHKVCSIFLELTGIQHPGSQTAADAVVDWLRSAIQLLPHGRVGTSEETSFLAECSSLFRAVAKDRDEATAAGNRPDASLIHNFPSSRNLKKHLRSFAECHQLDTA